MTFFSKLNPVPSFPAFSGPYTVGTCDCEFPVHELESPAEAPNPDAPGTVAFRIFYPCTSDSSQTHRPVRWLPSPQRGYFSAYARFLGANSAVSDAFSLFPQLLNYTTIPALRNAQLLDPGTKNNRWPVMFFSHGLGGSRNAYSYIVGTLASHGIVVIAPDHRDESAPISYIRATDKTPAKTLGYQRHPHTPTQEVYDGRDAQLKIRLWELGLIHDAVLRIDVGTCPANLDPNSSNRWKKTVHNVLDQFKGRLDVQRPGSVIWAGHSFGACTMVQLMKSTTYQIDAEKAAQVKYSPLFVPGKTSALAKQIRSSSSVILLDMWCLPLRSPATKWLWERPMPSYAAGGSGGKAILSILSDAFVKWSGNLNDTKRALQPPKDQAGKMQGPYIFYPATSAHLSQSDFGILFPWLLKQVLKVEEPERIVKLNARAILQLLRNNGHEVSDTSSLDMDEKACGPTTAQDTKILESGEGAVRGWAFIGTDVEDEDVSVKQESKAPADEVDEEQIVGDVEL